MRLQVFLLLTSFALLFIECTQKVPSSIVPEEKFANLSADIYYLNSTLDILPLRYKDSIISLERNRLFEKYGINDSLFLQSLKFYNVRPKMMEKVEEIVRDELMKRISNDSIDTGSSAKDTLAKFK